MYLDLKVHCIDEEFYMGLSREYPEEFERIWKAWPKWPKGRSKKHESYRKWVQVVRDDGLDNDDVNELVALIERMKTDRQSWQRGNPYGPQGLQVWLHQRGWQDEYETTSGGALGMPEL